MTRPRYAVLAVGLLVLAGMRVAQDSPLWAAVFAVAAVSNAWLAFHRDDREESEPSPGAVRVSLERYANSVGRWQVIGVLAAAVGVLLLFLEPSLGLLAGSAALFCLHQARRARRATNTLQQIAAR